MNVRPALLAAATLAATLGICLALYRWGARGIGDLWTLTRAVQHGEKLEAHVEASRRRDEAPEHGDQEAARRPPPHRRVGPARQRNTAEQRAAHVGDSLHQVPADLAS